MAATTVAIINMKGGVGKTTLTVNLSACLAEKHHKRVLIIDLDPQFNATQYLIPDDQYKNHIELVLEGQKFLVSDIFKRQNNFPSMTRTTRLKSKNMSITLTNLIISYPTLQGKLDIIPSHLELMDLPYTKRGTENRLNYFLNKFAKNTYDFIFIDCPPTLSIFTLSAYIASDAILTPVKPDYLSSLGLPLLRRAIEEYRQDTGKDPKNLGIIFSMVNENTTVMKEGKKRITESSHGTYIFQNALRHGTSIAEAVQSNTPIFKYQKARDYWSDIYNITEEFLDRIKKECKL